MDATRVDRWLWAVRLYKTRTAATEACKAGHVRVNDDRAKPATSIGVGDTVRARVGDREHIVEVARVIATRVGAPVAAECLIDRSPPAPPRELAAPAARRDRGTGRPSKRDRRQLDRAQGRRKR
jgi:ribosome-associated heat shock protein Hsp15